MGNLVGAYLVSPGGNVEGYGQNADLSGVRLGITGLTLTATALNPVQGTWTLVVAFAEPVAGTEVSDPYTGYVTLAAAASAASAVPRSPLPDGITLVPGIPVTIPVTITNNSNAPQDYYLDPRLNTTATVTLAPLTFGAVTPFAAGSAKTALPIQQSALTSLYFVPSHTSSITVQQASTVPAMTDLSTAIGDPDVGPSGLSGGSLCGKTATETYTSSGGMATSGLWAPAPTECGPYPSAAPSASATDTLTATTAGFDKSVTVATGDLERLAQSASAGSAGIDQAVELKSGQSARVNVTFSAAGTPGNVVVGTLYLDTLQSGVPPYGQITGDEVAALPYAYKVG
jgi:hypothetical protein